MSISLAAAERVICRQSQWHVHPINPVTCATSNNHTQQRQKIKLKQKKRTNEDGKCCQAHRQSAPWILWDAAEIYLDRFPIWRILDFIFFFICVGCGCWVDRVGQTEKTKKQKNKKQTKKNLSDENSRASHRLILDSLSCSLLWCFCETKTKQTHFSFCLPPSPFSFVDGRWCWTADGIECIGLAVVATRRAQREDLNLATSRWAERYLFSSFSSRGEREKLKVLKESWKIFTWPSRVEK